MKTTITSFAILVMGLAAAQNVGIGTTSTTKSLHVKSTDNSEKILTITDGTEKASYLLTAKDAQGNSMWAPRTFGGKTIVIGTLGPGLDMTSTAKNAQTWKNTGTYIDLPPGRWAVSATFVMISNVAANNKTSTYYIKNTFSESPTGTAVSPDIEIRRANGSLITDALPTYISGTLYAPMPFALIRGSAIINNSSGASKKYYLISNFFRSSTNTNTTLTKYASASAGENILYALPLNDTPFIP